MGWGWEKKWEKREKNGNGINGNRLGTGVGFLTSYWPSRLSITALSQSPPFPLPARAGPCPEAAAVPERLPNGSRWCPERLPNGSRWFPRVPGRGSPLPVPPLTTFEGPRCPSGLPAFSPEAPALLIGQRGCQSKLAANQVGAGAGSQPTGAPLLPIFGFNSRFLVISGSTNLPSTPQPRIFLFLPHSIKKKIQTLSKNNKKKKP